MRIATALRLAACAALLAVFLAPRAKADDWNKKTIVTFAESVQIPGHVLPPGTYVFKLLDSPSDRNIVQVWSSDETQLFATVLAVSDYRMDPADHPIFEFDERPADQPVALRSWFSTGDLIGRQFIYTGY